MSEEVTGVEVSEVAEPIEEEVTGVEEQETAEPVSEDTVEEEPKKTEEDAAWARMRREKEDAIAQAEAAQKELAELKAMQEAREEAESRLVGQDEARIKALAEVTGMSEDEVLAELEAAEEAAKKDLRIAELEQQVQSVELDRIMQADLAELQKIDPSIKSLEDLGDDYSSYISAGLDAEQAYWAIKAKEEANRATPPKPAGAVKTSVPEKDYYTESEIDAMSSEELTKNWKKVMASWDRRSK